MRRSLVFLSLLLAACTGRQQPHLGFEPRDSTAPTADTTLLPVQPAGTVPVRFWSGTLEGGIPVVLGMVEEDGVACGAVTYTATSRPAPLRLLGTHDAEDGSYRLLEMPATGSVTGIFTGTMQGRTFTGEWFSPRDRRRRPFRLEARDSLLTEAAAAAYRLQHSFGPGRYVYQYGPDGPAGLLEATRQGTDRVGLSFSNHHGAPGYNLADLDAGELLLRNGYEVLYAAQDSTLHCRFRARFYTGFAVVDQTGSDADCGFGMGATINGIYVRTEK